MQHIQRTDTHVLLVYYLTCEYTAPVDRGVQGYFKSMLYVNSVDVNKYGVNIGHYLGMHVIGQFVVML